MAKRFPRTESDIAKLAGRVVDGLTNAAEDFPAPPVSSEELRGKLDAFQASDTATVAAETAFRNQHAEKDEVLEELVDALKADLRYAPIGSGTSCCARRARRPSSLIPTSFRSTRSSRRASSSSLSVTLSPDSIPCRRECR